MISVEQQRITRSGSGEPANVRFKPGLGIHFRVGIVMNKPFLCAKQHFVILQHDHVLEVVIQEAPDFVE